MNPLPSLPFVFLLAAATLAPSTLSQRPNDPAVEVFHSTPAWRRLLADTDGAWSLDWNVATGTPRALYGRGITLADWRGNSLEEARRHAHAASERLRAVFNASRDALILADGESGEILDVNRQAEILVGCDRAALLGRDQGSLYPLEQRQRAAGEFRRLLEGVSPWALVTEVQHSEGRRVPVEISAEVADLSDGHRLALSIFRPF